MTSNAPSPTGLSASVEPQTTYTAASRSADKSTIVEMLIVLAAVAAGLAIVQYAAAGLIGTDGYYHIKIAYLIRTEGLRPVFDQLPHTILNEASFYDHHFLYHVFLALFAWENPLIDGGIGLTKGAKLASLLLPTAAFTAIWWVLKRQQVQLAALWAVGLLALSEPFLYRMSMPRAQAVSLFLLVVGIQLLLEKKFRWLVVVGFTFVWAYNAFPLLLVMAAVYVAAVWLTERRVEWRALLWPVVGIGLGLLINPYFPQNISFIIDHLAPKIGESAVKVGNEWTAYRTSTLLENSGWTFVVLMSAVLAIAWHRDRIDQRTLFLLGMTTVFGAMLFESRRFIEYFPPFVLLLAAFAWQPLLEEGGNRLPVSVTRWRPLLLGLLALGLFLPLSQTVRGAAAQAAAGRPADRYAAASLWLAERAEPGGQIFQTDWDDFTRLYFYNSDVRYTIGLDPTFMELHDPALFEQWVAITRGEVDQPGEIIRDQFGAAFIFSDLNHAAFEESVQDDPLIKEIYRDEDAVIYEVRPQQRQGDQS